MSETGWAAFVGELHEEETAVQRSARLAGLAAEREDREAARTEAERAAAIEGEREARLIRYAQLGLGGRSLGEVFAAAGRDLDEDAEYEAARAVMAKIERRRESRARAQRFQAEQVTAVSRAQVPADPLEAAQRRAHEAFAAATRHQLAEAATGTPQRERRPFAGGVAVRSEVTCQHCYEVGATAEESFLLHQDPSPPPVPAGVAPSSAPPRPSRRLATHRSCSWPMS